MTNEEKINEIGNSKPINWISNEDLCTYQQGLRRGAFEMAEWKDSQPQIIEIFGKRVKIIEEDYSSAENCKECALFEPCYSSNYTLCQTADEKFNQHFVEVDEDGNEIKQ